LLSSSEPGKFDELLLWGKIQAEKADYFVAMSVKFEGEYEFPIKEFYWCTSLQYQFKKFPELND